MQECFTGVCSAVMLRAVPRIRRNERFGQNLRRLRARKEWSQVELAARVNAKQPDVSGWERGGVPSLDKIVRLALALECSLDDLVRAVDKNYDEQQRRAGADIPEAVVKDERSEEASSIASAFDAGPEDLRVVIRGAVNLQANAGERNSGRRGSSADTRASSTDSRARAGKSRR